MAWLIAFGIVGVFALLAAMPLGISARYNADGATVKAIAGPVRIPLFPRKKKGPKAKEKPKKETEQQPGSEPKKAQAENQTGGSWKDFLPLVRTALDFLGDLRRKLRVDRLEMKLILAGGDPAELGIRYGRAWAALGSLWPELERVFVIKKRDVQVECDFTSSQTLVFARLELTIPLGRLIVMVLRYGIRALKEYLKIRNQRKGGAAT